MRSLHEPRTLRRASIVIGATSLVIIGALVGARMLVTDLAAGQAVDAPMFEVDALWPKPLPNQWLLGSAVGVAVDERDNVYVLHRRDSFNERTEVGASTDPPTGDCCHPAPAVLVFNAAGDLVRHWGGPGDASTWPESNHRLVIGPGGSVWIGGSGDGDTQLLRFSPEGRFQGALGGAPAGIDRPAEAAFDVAAGEVYVADGLAGRRVAVLDMNTGALKRQWGAYGEPPRAAEPARQDPAAARPRDFRSVHCIELSQDGLVYVCDRENNRIQVFRKDGTFLKEQVIAPETRGEGAVWDIAFSRDPQQRFMYVADGMNMRVHILDRQSLDLLTSFGAGGRQPGQFFAVHSIATDAQGNIYTAETYEGKRVQKFVFRGIGPVTSRDQGVLWPRR